MSSLNEPWLNWAIELQSIAQIGLRYTKDCYDKERFERIREISAEMLNYKTSISLELVKDLFCNETGYQTPKLDTRAAVFEHNKILLVKEQEKWSLPGGWVDVNESIWTNTIKETKEESGMDVIPKRLIAVQDRKKHNEPQYVYGICKVFVLCDLLGGSYIKNNETTDSSFFALDNLPELATAKNTYKQIQMCFQAKNDANWVVQFD